MVSLKAEQRDLVHGRRAARTADERRAAAAALCAHLLPRLAGTRVLAAHVPSPEEPGHGLLPAAFGPLGARVLLPVVPPSGRELSWAVDDGDLVPGRFGLLEPTGPRLPGSELGRADVVVLPATAVGRDGTRLGRGGGYYDRALAHAAPDALLVALLFDDELLEWVPAGPHDRRVHAVVTPSGWVQLAG